jgi:hypothetical protein
MQTSSCERKAIFWKLSDAMSHMQADAKWKNSLVILTLMLGDTFCHYLLRYYIKRDTHDITLEQQRIFIAMNTHLMMI